MRIFEAAVNSGNSSHYRMPGNEEGHHYGLPPLPVNEDLKGRDFHAPVRLSPQTLEERPGGQGDLRRPIAEKAEMPSKV